MLCTHAGLNPLLMDFSGRQWSYPWNQFTPMYPSLKWGGGCCWLINSCQLEAVKVSNSFSRAILRSLFTAQDKICPSSASKTPGGRCLLWLRVLRAWCCQLWLPEELQLHLWAEFGRQELLRWLAASSPGAQQQEGAAGLSCPPWIRPCCWMKMSWKQPWFGASRSEMCPFTTVRRSSQKELQTKWKIFVLPSFTVTSGWGASRFEWLQGRFEIVSFFGWVFLRDKQ